MIRAIVKTIRIGEEDVEHHRVSIATMACKGETQTKRVESIWYILEAWSLAHPSWPLLQSLNACRYKAETDLWLDKHPPTFYIPLHVNILPWYHVQVKRPQDLGDEEPALPPGNLLARAGPRSLAEGMEVVQHIVAELWVVEGVVRGQPSLWMIVSGVVEVTRAVGQSVRARLTDGLDQDTSLVQMPARNEGG